MLLHITPPTRVVAVLYQTGKSGSILFKGNHVSRQLRAKRLLKKFRKGTGQCGVAVKRSMFRFKIVTPWLRGGGGGREREKTEARREEKA